jgi:hypothetical protein
VIVPFTSIGIENVERGYRARNIDILSNSGAAIKALESFQVNSNLVWVYHQSLVKVAENYMIWLPRHMGNNGNEITVATRGSSHPLIRPEPALGTSATVARGVIKDWASRKHMEHWLSIHGKRWAKDFPKKTLCEKAGELLSLSRN